jgi:hypothetical protein
MAPTVCIVLTTIFDPVLLDDYYENLKRHSHLEQATVFLIPDVKTPRQAYERCRNLSGKGINIVCPTIDEQEVFLERVGFPAHLIPRNSDNRRNVGFLMALESGGDFIISLDDDNYCRLEEDFLGEHSIVCNDPARRQVVDSETGWFNICDLLELDRANVAYARGFPFYARHRNTKCSASEKLVDVHMNAGLWLADPDMDALTWLVSPAKAAAFRGESVVLGRNTWSPINTQNTSLRREVVATYYYIRMNYPLLGTSIDRYGDIFSGYFAQACVRKMNGAIRVGTPLAVHKRNSHSYVKDALNEMAGIALLEELLPWLTEVTLQGTNYYEAYESLSYEIEDRVESFQGATWDDASKAYFHQMAYCMRKWLNCCRTIG